MCINGILKLSGSGFPLFWRGAGGEVHTTLLNFAKTLNKNDEAFREH